MKLFKAAANTDQPARALACVFAHSRQVTLVPEICSGDLGIRMIDRACARTRRTRVHGVTRERSRRRLREVAMLSLKRV